MNTAVFAASSDKHQLESGNLLTPRFDENGLVTAVVLDAQTREILMLAHMNDEALAKTLETGFAHFWSRSRNELWKKGETSGNMLAVNEVRVDCDQDAVCVLATVAGSTATCHTGRRSCFYRKAELQDGKFVLIDDGTAALFDPEKTYQSGSSE